MPRARASEWHDLRMFRDFLLSDDAQQQQRIEARALASEVDLAPAPCPSLTPGLFLQPPPDTTALWAPGSSFEISAMIPTVVQTLKPSRQKFLSHTC